MRLQRRRVLQGAAGLAVLGAGGGAYWHYRERQGMPQGEGSPMMALATDAPADAAALWQLAFEQPDGGMLRLAALRGRPLLVNFWATWCGPCVKEMPLLDRWAAQQRELAVVGIAVDRMAAVRDFLKRTPVRFHIAVAGFAGTELARTLGNPQGALPFSVLIARNGHVLARKLGETQEEDLRSWSRLVLARHGDNGPATA